MLGSWPSSKSVESLALHSASGESGLLIPVRRPQNSCPLLYPMQRKRFAGHLPGRKLKLYISQSRGVSTKFTLDQLENGGFGRVSLGTQNSNSCIINISESDRFLGIPVAR